VADSAPRFTGSVRAQTYTVGAAIRTLWLPKARGGNGALTYRLTPAVPGLVFNARQRRLTGTPTRAGTYRMTYRVTDADANTRASDTDTRSFVITVEADNFPAAIPPGNPPQATGRDLRNVEVAGAQTTRYVLVRNRSSASVTYRRGTWLEPKDGSYQRMIVARTVTVPRGRVLQVPTACMQQSKGVPASGLRFYSQPKAASGAVQSCQRRCLGESAVQPCVWSCENSPPVTRGTIPDQMLTTGLSESLDVSPYFSDPDGDTLTYAAQSDNPRVATAGIAGATLTLRAISAGTATVTVTARDPGRQSVSLSFNVRVAGDDFPAAVAPRNPPQATGRDLPNVEVAGAGTVQHVLVRNNAFTPVTYSQGTWLEPKDGGYQRMIVTETVTVGREVARVPTACMQRSNGVPATGIRFYSQPKPATGTVQSCQRRCLGAGGNVQGCVWNCERQDGGGGGQSSCSYQQGDLGFCVLFRGEGFTPEDTAQWCNYAGTTVGTSCPSGASGSFTCTFSDGYSVTTSYYGLSPSDVATFDSIYRQSCISAGGAPS